MSILNGDEILQGLFDLVQDAVTNYIHDHYIMTRNSSINVNEYRYNASCTLSYVWQPEPAHVPCNLPQKNKNTQGWDSVLLH